MVSFSYNEWQFAEFEREGGHMIIEVTVYDDGMAKSSANLVFDTGAYITVLSRTTAKRAGLSLGTGKPAKLQGFSRKHDPIIGELIEIPCFVVGKHFVYDAKAVVPLDDIAISEVLGGNILEYFDYNIDHVKNSIYFKKNPDPKPYINEEKGIDLSCGKVLLADI